MTDRNTYAIDEQPDDRKDCDPLQKVTAELEQAEARIEELEAMLAKAVIEMEKVDAYLTRLQTPNTEPLNSVNSCGSKKGRGQYTAMVRNEAREFWASLGKTLAELKGEK